MKAIYLILVVSVLMALASCQNQQSPLTDDEKKQITETTSRIVQEIIDDGNQKITPDSATVTLFKKYFSDDPTLRVVIHGSLYTSRGQMLDSIMSQKNFEFKKLVESFSETIDRFDVAVLSRESIAITTPCHWRIKIKDIPEYSGTEVLTWVFQKNDGTWKIILGTIADPNLCQAMSALMPPKK